MPKKKIRYDEKPWNPDPAKWNRHFEKQPSVKSGQLKTPDEPKGGWMLYRWDNLEDAPQ